MEEAGAAMSKAEPVHLGMSMFGCTVERAAAVDVGGGAVIVGDLTFLSIFIAIQCKHVLFAKKNTKKLLHPL